MPAVTANVAAPASEEERLVRRLALCRKLRQKGYARLNTSLGALNVELHFDLAPRTCHNFVELCKRKKYDGTIFHRNIPGFMVQGGDPSGTGRGGKSIWGGKFADEIHPDNTHSARGTLSMANAGPSEREIM